MLHRKSLGLIWRRTGQRYRMQGTRCENCGEHYVSEDVTQKLLSRAEVAVQNGAEVEILAYAA